MILIPKNVYIGDTAELHCAFNADFGTLAENLKNGEAVELSLSGFDEPTQTETYQIKKVALTKTGVNFYNIVARPIPRRARRHRPFRSTRYGKNERKQGR